MRQLQNLWARIRWVVLIGSVALAFALGCIGFWQHAMASGTAASPMSIAYRAVQLFVLDGGVVEEPTPVALEIARWLAPVSLAFAAVGTFVTLVRRSAWGWGVRTATDHVVVIGLGERGWRVVRSVLDNGGRAVVIEADPQAPRIAEARRASVPVLVGQADDPRMLRRARLQFAKRAHVLVGDPDAAARIARGLAAWCSTNEHRLPAAFCCYIAESDADAVRELNALLTADAGSVRTEFFSVEDRAGVAIVDRWNPDLARRTVVVGDGVTARSVLGAIARESRARSLDDVDVTWLLPAAQIDLCTRSLLVQHPATSALELRVLDAQDSGDALAGADLVVVAERDDARALRAVALAERGDAGHIVIAAGDRSLTAMLHGRPRVDVFSVDTELCTDEAIAHGRLEAMARALHRGYLRELDASLSPAERMRKRAYRPWDTLDPALRDSNYAAARAAWDFLTDAGYRIITRSAGVDGLDMLPPEVVDDLARREHTRWLRDADPAATVPAWSDVDERSRAQSRDQMSRLPATLAAADLSIVPTGGAVASVG